MERIKKTLSVSLIVTFLTLVGGICLQSPLDPISGVRQAQAAEAASVSGGCGGDSHHEPAERQSNEGKSVLPCCVDGGHTGALFNAQSVETVKSPALAAAVYPLLFSPIFKTSIRYILISDPPDLASVRTIVLRV